MKREQKGRQFEEKLDKVGKLLEDKEKTLKEKQAARLEAERLKEKMKEEF